MKAATNADNCKFSEVPDTNLYSISASLVSNSINVSGGNDTEKNKRLDSKQQQLFKVFYTKILYFCLILYSHNYDI